MDAVMDFLFGPGPIVWVQHALGSWPLPFRVLSLAGAAWGVIAAGGLALWLWGRRDAYAVAGIAVLQVAATLALNAVFGLARPDAPGIVKYEHVQASAFPSGHVFTATAVWGLLYARGRLPLPVAGAIVGGVAVSRLFLGVHFLGDVLGGFAFGIALVAAYRAAERVLELRTDGWTGPSPAPLALGAAVAAGAALALWISDGIPSAWRGAGAAVGAAAALPLERRWRKGAGPPLGEGGKTWGVLLGLGGFVPLVLAGRLAGADWPPIEGVASFAGALWALLLMPLWLDRSAGADRDAGREHGSAWRRAALAAGAVLGLLALYGTAVEPRLVLDVEEHAAALPGLPPEWEGRTVAVIADLQVGMWWANTGMARRAVREAVRRRPAAVLLAGDFIYHPGRDPRALAREAAEIVAPLARAGIPAFAVLGNHDWAMDRPDGSMNPLAARRVREALAAAGVRVLDNEAVALAAPGGGAPLYVVGIGSRWASRDRPAAALAGVPPGAARVVVMHNPDSFGAIPAGRAPLAVAGHTHGGQVALPFLEGWSWLALTQPDRVHADGWARGAGAAGNRLYVNRGIGFSSAPVRINCAPELTLLTLRRASPSALQVQPDDDVRQLARGLRGDGGVAREEEGEIQVGEAPPGGAGGEDRLRAVQPRDGEPVPRLHHAQPVRAAAGVVDLAEALRVRRVGRDQRERPRAHPPLDDPGHLGVHGHHHERLPQGLRRRLDGLRVEGGGHHQVHLAQLRREGGRVQPLPPAGGGDRLGLEGDGLQAELLLQLHADRLAGVPVGLHAGAAQPDPPRVAAHELGEVRDPDPAPARLHEHLRQPGGGLARELAPQALLPGHVGPGAPAHLHQPLRLQRPVRGAHGAVVRLQVARHLAHAGEALAPAEVAQVHLAHDAVADALDEHRIGSHREGNVLGSTACPLQRRGRMIHDV
ncbi:MAG TPA: phosphatase PAP2 family protein [Longimicrobium sp.]|nr:phosphatase PAP2 family protein [Longimicrobium sp.]